MSFVLLSLVFNIMYTQSTHNTTCYSLGGTFVFDSPFGNELVINDSSGRETTYISKISTRGCKVCLSMLYTYFCEYEEFSFRGKICKFQGTL